MSSAPLVKAAASPVGPVGDKLIPGLKDIDAWCLLLTPATDASRKELFRIGLAAMRGQAGLVWHASTGGWRSAQLGAKLRALGSSGDLTIGDPVVSSTFDLPGKRFYADVAWIAADASEGLQQFLARPTATIDSAVAFFPEMSNDRAAQWGTATIGLTWLWAKRTMAVGTMAMSMAASNILLTLIIDTIRLHGTLLLILTTEDHGRLPWFVSSATGITRAKQELARDRSVEWVQPLQDLGPLTWLDLAP
jgi:hypothetical protein